VLYFAAGNALYIGGESWRRLSGSPSYMIVAALIGLALGTVPNLLGLQFGKWIANIGAFARWAALLALVAIGLVAWTRLGSATRFTGASFVPGLGLRNLVFWSTIAFALTRLESASVMGEDI